MIRVDLFCLCRELNDNRLTGHIPPELGKLTDLFDLYVMFSLTCYVWRSLCFLSTNSISFCSNVANNYLDGPIPDNISSCTNLNSL